MQGSGSAGGDCWVRRHRYHALRSPARPEVWARPRGGTDSAENSLRSMRSPFQATMALKA